MTCLSPSNPYFNPRSPRGERRAAQLRHACAPVISIHAPLAGSDKKWSEYYHSLQFQSTLPSRGATVRQYYNITFQRYFNPRSPRGERHLHNSHIQATFNFNPRSPRGERPPQPAYVLHYSRFQSTLPSRGATDRNTWSAHCFQFQSTLPSRGATGPA